MKKSELRQLLQKELDKLGEGKKPINKVQENYFREGFYQQKSKLSLSLENETIDLLKYFSDYYKNNKELNRLFTSSYKQLEKIKNEIRNYQPYR